MKISENIILNAPQEKIFTFLSKMSNHQQLMPQELITDWCADDDTCRFKLKNMLYINLKISNREAYTMLQAIPTKETPIDINLQWEIKAIDAQKCEAIYTIQANINMMMQMIAKPILAQLIHHELKTLQQLLNN